MRRKKGVEPDLDEIKQWLLTANDADAASVLFALAWLLVWLLEGQHEVGSALFSLGGTLRGLGVLLAEQERIDLDAAPDQAGGEVPNG